MSAIDDEDTVDDGFGDGDDAPIPFVLAPELLLDLDEQVRAVEPLVPVVLFASRAPAPILPPPIDEGRFVGDELAPAVLFLVGPAAGDAS